MTEDTWISNLSNFRVFFPPLEQSSPQGTWKNSWLRYLSLSGFFTHFIPLILSAYYDVFLLFFFFSWVEKQATISIRTARSSSVETFSQLWSSDRLPAATQSAKHIKWHACKQQYTPKQPRCSGWRGNWLRYTFGDMMVIFQEVWKRNKYLELHGHFNPEVILVWY